MLRVLMPAIPYIQLYLYLLLLQSVATILVDKSSALHVSIRQIHVL